MATPGQLMFARGLSPTARLIIWILLGTSLAVVDVRLGALGVLRSAFSRVMQPVQQAALAPFKMADGVGGFLVRHHELQQERDRLSDERLGLQRELYAARDSQRENQELRNLLVLARRPGQTALAANVLYQGQDWFSRRITIDKGSSAGLREGLPVMDAQGLVGQVTRVYPGASEVMLISNNEQLTPVFVQRTGQRALAAGASQIDQIEIRFIPIHADIQPGDLLLTSGIDKVYPPGLPVARVNRVTRPQGGAYARVECVPLAGVSRDRALLVLLPAIEVPRP
ncbi:MAG: rod shape-determining protein MreC [Thiobacillaceae bacterium]